MENVDLESVLRTLGRADACVSFLLQEVQNGEKYVDIETCLTLLGVPAIQPTIITPEADE